MTLRNFTLYSWLYAVPVGDVSITTSGIFLYNTGIQVVKVSDENGDDFQCGKIEYMPHQDNFNEMPHNILKEKEKDDTADYCQIFFVIWIPFSSPQG